MVGRFQSNWA